MNDPTPGQIQSLSPRMAAIAVNMCNAFRSAGIPLAIVANGARRSPSVQAGLVKAGFSKTHKSAHLTGDAVDFDVLGWRRDDLPQEFFQILGEIGESYGLTWGGRWTSPYDPGHFELPPALRSVS